MQKAVVEIDAPTGRAAAGSAPARPGVSAHAVFPVLIALSFSHMLNDMMQSLIPSLYPMLKTTYRLSFTQIGLITLTFQMTASLLQPLVGVYTDRRPLPYSLATGMGFTLVGLLLLSMAGSYPALLLAGGMVGMGSSVFHPESSRVARLASGGRFGMAQSLFQVGGNAGSAVGPLLAMLVLTGGQGLIAWFSLIALLGMLVLGRVGMWYGARVKLAPPAGRSRSAAVPRTGTGTGLSRRRIGVTIAVLGVLIFSKYFYISSINSYFTFYLIQKFGLSVHAAQLHLFMFMAALAAGTLTGGPIGDHIGRNRVIWMSILGVLPFTLLLPYADLFWTDVLVVLIGMILASAFPAILVYAQELVPGRVGMIAGIFFGLAFGLGGLGAAVLGRLADATSIAYVYHLCSFLPALGVLTVFLPNLKRRALA